MSKIRYLNSCLFPRIRVGLFSQEPAEGGKLDLAGSLGFPMVLPKHCSFPPVPRGGLHGRQRPPQGGNLAKPTTDPQFLWPAVLGDACIGGNAQAPPRA